jgi:hypothetical protein
VRHDRVSATVDLQPGEIIDTNLMDAGVGYGQILTLLGILGLAANVLLRRPWRRSQRPPRSTRSTR